MFRDNEIINNFNGFRGETRRIYIIRYIYSITHFTGYVNLIIPFANSFSSNFSALADTNIDGSRNIRSYSQIAIRNSVQRLIGTNRRMLYYTNKKNDGDCDYFTRRVSNARELINRAFR